MRLLKRSKKRPEEKICREFIIQLDRLNELDKRLNKIFIYHITNEGTASKTRGKMLKAIGLRAGVSDYFVMRAMNQWHGLYIEMKDDKKKPTKTQIEFMEKAQSEGYKTVVAYSAKEAIDAIYDYLEIKL